MNIHQLLHMAMDDPKFYEQLKHDPEGALRSRGMHPTEAHIRALKSLNYRSLEEVATAFGPHTFVT